MKTHDLTLHVGEGKHLKDGWEHTTSESGTLYRYKYTPTAYVHQEVGDRVTINIALDSNVLDDYAIESVSFPTDPRSQLFLADQNLVAGSSTGWAVRIKICRLKHSAIQILSIFTF